MVSCLALIHETHLRVAKTGGFHGTACGLSIADEHVERGLFAEALDRVSCMQCRQAHQRASEADKRRDDDPKMQVSRLFATVIGAKTSAHRAPLAGPLSDRLTARRLDRLHQLFPGWSAEIDDLIADKDSVVVRYHVSFCDAFGLLGPQGLATRSGQAALFRIADGTISEVCTIVDDFGIWDEAASSCRIGCSCLRHDQSTTPFTTLLPELGNQSTAGSMP